MLRSVMDQTVAPDEVIIVDQSNADDTQGLIGQFLPNEEQRKLRSPRFVYRYEPGLPGAGAARNLGITLSTCSILLFLDDDVLLEPDFVEALLGVYRRHPAVGGVSGIITNYSRPRFRERILEQLFCLGPFHDERLAIYWNASRLRPSEPIPVRKVSGCVMSVRRSALGDKRFDAQYRGAGAEDVDLSWRLSEVSPIVLTPAARVRHLRTESGPRRQHWLTSTVCCHYYLYYRLWRGSLFGTLCFLWLNCGFVLVATVSSLRQRSVSPYRNLRAGIRQSRELLAADCQP